MSKHYAGVTVGPDDLNYPNCGACGWTGTGTADYEAARREADGHTDPEVLAELKDFDAVFAENPFSER